jgi:hypothetical protein
MTARRALAALVIAVLLCASAPLFSAIQLTTVLTGLSSPLFVGHAGDGSDRLFVVERGGLIKVLQPGASSPTVFLDIRAKVLAGGEQGLLGLAFHPDHESNGRFFVFYTRPGDQALVIAEYGLTTNPNVADPDETIILVIPHPTNANHNGGMLEFGPDGFLYIGVGDGGGADDVPNNAQSLDVLLGKILRIDIDPPAGSGAVYVSPPTNPFFGMAGAREEIFAYGLRNPWRFSFDRLTGQQWVADVGQGAREEVDTPIVNGGNYGWRVYEGTSCTNNDPPLCDPSAYLFPLFEYTHTGNRCSITGGYVYRGLQSAVGDGTYVYGDFCTGEIFGWDGSTQVTLLDTSLNISSFGEDESGELYVVGLGGTVSRIVSALPCTYAITPRSQDVEAAGAVSFVGVAAGAGCGWTAVSHATWIHVSSGDSGSGNGRVLYSVDVNTSPSPRTGMMTIAGQTFTVNQAATACSMSISPVRATLPPPGGTGSVMVTTGPGCSWTAVSRSPWITITGGFAGTGNGIVTYTVAPFPGEGNRNGRLTIAGLTFMVKQTK